jgi:hypothetical protein
MRSSSISLKIGQKVMYYTNDQEIKFKKEERNTDTFTA